MEIADYYDGDEVPARVDRTEPLEGIYSVPVIGNAAAGVRRFYDNMAPREADSAEVRAAKEVFRWSSAVAGAAAVAVVVL